METEFKKNPIGINSSFWPEAHSQIILRIKYKVPHTIKKKKKKKIKTTMLDATIHVLFSD